MLPVVIAAATIAGFVAISFQLSGDALHHAAHPSWPLLATAFAVAALAQPLRAMAWRATLHGCVEFKAVYAASAVGSFLDTVLPARLGEVSKVGVLRVPSGSRWPGFPRAAGSLLCAHLLEALAFVVVGAAAARSSRSRTGHGGRWSVALRSRPGLSGGRAASQARPGAAPAPGPVPRRGFSFAAHPRPRRRDPRGDLDHPLARHRASAPRARCRGGPRSRSRLHDRDRPRQHRADPAGQRRRLPGRRARRTGDGRRGRLEGSRRRARRTALRQCRHRCRRAGRCRALRPALRRGFARAPFRDSIPACVSASSERSFWPSARRSRLPRAARSPSRTPCRAGSRARSRSTRTTRPPSRFLRVPTAGRARLFLLGKKAPKPGLLIDTKTFDCQGAAGSFICQASYEPLPKGKYTWKIAWWASPRRRLTSSSPSAGSARLASAGWPQRRAEAGGVPRRPQSRAAGDRAADRRARARRRRRRLGEDARAHAPRRAPHRHAGREAERDPRHHVHEQGGG